MAIRAPDGANNDIESSLSLSPVSIINNEIIKKFIGNFAT